MLSLFPSLFTFQLLSPTLLRLTLGVILVLWAYSKFKHKAKGTMMFLGAVEALVGILLIIGLWTQLAALIATLIFLGHLLLKIKNKAFLTDGVNYYFILLIISLSLMLTGPGFFAFDLPL